MEKIQWMYCHKTYVLILYNNWSITNVNAYNVSFPSILKSLITDNDDSCSVIIVSKLVDLFVDELEENMFQPKLQVTCTIIGETHPTNGILNISYVCILKLVMPFINTYIKADQHPTPTGQKYKSMHLEVRKAHMN